MGINIIEGPTKNLTNYTFHWLRHMVEWAGMQDEDVELLSICDIEELALLRKPKTRKLRIVGGPETFNDRFYGMFADALVVGEGFEFFRAYKEGGLEHALAQPFVWTPGKQEVIPSTVVDWDLAPPIRVGKRKLMALGGRGCKNKCKFCFTSWTTKHVNAPAIQIPEAFKGFALNIITNDSGGEAVHHRVANRSIPVKQYLAMTMDEAKLCRYYRFGIESFTEAGRRFFGKPIANEELRLALFIASKLNHDVQLFIIAGIEPQESAIEFIEAMGPMVAKKPRVIVKVTYFNPCIHTPLEAFDISSLHNWDRDWLYSRLTAASSRYRLTMAGDAGHAVYRGLVKRCRTLDEVEALWRVRNEKRTVIDATVRSAGLEALYAELPASVIKFDWRTNKRFDWRRGIK